MSIRFANLEELKSYKVNNLNELVEIIQKACPQMGGNTCFPFAYNFEGRPTIKVFWENCTPEESKTLSAQQRLARNGPWMQDPFPSGLLSTIVTKVGNEDMLIELVHEKSETSFYTTC